MKLRNKKTGEIKDVVAGFDVTGIYVCVDNHNGNPYKKTYRSIKELTEDWEDYDSSEMTVKCAECGKLFKIPKLDIEENVYGVCPECQVGHLMWS